MQKIGFKICLLTFIISNLSFVYAETLDEITNQAKQEATINSLGMPDTWANWKDTWHDLDSKYNVKHIDTDMSSAQEIAKFKAEKENSSADIGDVGVSFAPIAVQQGVTQPYKTHYWDQIPDWAKDKDGNWLVAYTGTIAFIVDKKLVKNIPHSWDELAKGQYKITLGDVSIAAQAVNGVLSANYALGGDEKDLTPALNYFSEIAKQGRLGMTDISISNLEKGEIEVGILWDFNGLNYRDKIDPSRFEVIIPSDGSVTSGYTTIINKYAKHPNAAKLAREYILSDAGQINLAKGFARPIRVSNIKLSQDLKDKLLPAEQYKNAKTIKDYKIWEETSKKLPALWQQKVLINM